MTLPVLSVLRGVFTWRNSPQWAGASPMSKFTISLRQTTLSRTPLYEWSARRTDLYLTTDNTHNRQTFMPPVGFEPAIPASYRPQTHAFDHATTGINFFLRSIAAGILKLRHCVEVNAELHAHDALPSMEDPSVFCGQKVGWVNAPVWMLNWRAIFLSLSVIKPLICKQRVPPKDCYLRAKLHGVTSHKAVTVIYCYSSLVSAK